MTSKEQHETDDDFDDLVYRTTPGAPTFINNENDRTSYKNFKSKSKQSNRIITKIPEPPTRTSSYLSRSKGSTTRIGTGIGTGGTSSTTAKKIPPKIVVKFFIHEEASSIQELQKPNIDHISCHVTIEGTIHAQIISSDAIKNPPFAIRLCDPDYPEDNYQFDTNFMTYYGSGEFNTLNIPKAVLGQIKVASYQRSVTKKFMPVLVQSKIVRTGSHLEKCLLAIQIRSNLKNKGSLKDLIVCCAVPPTVISKTLSITTGEGIYDDLKRMIQWNVKELPVGNSLIFRAEVDIAMKNISVDDLPKFPILIRCASLADTVSSVEVELREVEGYPTTIVPLRHHSFRLLHRLPS